MYYTVIRDTSYFFILRFLSIGDVLSVKTDSRKRSCDCHMFYSVYHVM